MYVNVSNHFKADMSMNIDFLLLSRLHQRPASKLFPAQVVKSGKFVPVP
jgi:hypothetical protein